MRAQRLGSTLAIVVTATSVLSPETVAQTRCEPTISQPCKPSAVPIQPAPANAAKPREGTRLDPQPVLPEIKVDKDTSVGFGQGGGIFGLERKINE